MNAGRILPDETRALSPRPPRTPVDRVLASPDADPARVADRRLRARLDPFAVAAAIDHKLEHIFTLATPRPAAAPVAAPPGRRSKRGAGLTPRSLGKARPRAARRITWLHRKWRDDLAPVTFLNGLTGGPASLHAGRPAVLTAPLAFTPPRRARGQPLHPSYALKW